MTARPSTTSLSNQTPAAFRRKADADFLAGRDLHRSRRRDEHFLPHVHYVIAMSAEECLAAHDARQHVVAVVPARMSNELEVVRLHADRHGLSRLREIAGRDLELVAADLDVP